MEKRLPLAIFLSAILIFGWQMLYGPAMSVEPPPATAPGIADPSDRAPDVVGDTPAVATAEVDEAEVEEARERWTQWLELGSPGTPGHYWARFDNRGGRLLDLRVSGYYVVQGLDDEQRADRENWTRVFTSVESDSGSTGSMVLSLSASSAGLSPRPLKDVLWEHEVVQSPDDPDVILGVRFTHASTTGVTFVKTIVTDPGYYRLLVSIGVANETPELAGPRQFVFTPAACMPAETDDSFYAEPNAVVAWGPPDDIEVDSEARRDGANELTGGFSIGGQVSWAGVHNKYFATLFRGADESVANTLAGASWRRVHDAEFAREFPNKANAAYRYIVTDIDLLFALPESGERVYEYVVYAGPKDRAGLAANFPSYSALVDEDLGFFDGIAGLLLRVLGFFHGLTQNWGVAIILLTLSVRIVLFPINRRSQVAMARHATKMKRVQPKLNELKERHANNPQKLRQEQARIMQEEGAFPPLGGCLPLFLQIPVFFGLFSALRVSFDLRQAPFAGWIRDLSQPDRLMRLDLDTHLPIIGTIEWLNVLPPLMVVLWILQQAVMPKPTDEQALRMQRMMMFMPIVFGFMLYNYAAGLSLYMITQSLLSVAEQTVVKKIWPIDASEQPKKKSGFMSRLGELQEQAQKMQQQQQKKKQQGKSGSRRPPKKRKSG